jgi:riboflavin kinase/FMN adenylyltransferase
MSATSIGVRPTFGDNDIAIESHVLDFDQDLYDKEIELEFVSRIREEKKYDSIHELQEQIGRDVQEVRKVLRSGKCF